MNHYHKGKYLLRQAFAGQGYLPDDIIMREKAAFSDAVGHSLVDDLKDYAETLYTDEDVANAKEKYPYCTPFTKESLLYRDIFEEYFPGKAKWIRTSGCQTRNGRTVTLTIQAHGSSRTMVPVVNKADCRN